jgi:hypothetical protein
MARLLTLDDLQRQFDLARDRLSRNRKAILVQAPLSQIFNHDEYGFSYMRAERIGLNVITQSLMEISWLPVRIDPQTELLLENKKSMTKWLGSVSSKQPDSEAFGNDFIHALTRVALTQGWESSEFRVTALRIGDLFRDLSCLIGLIYYSVWMAENGIIGAPISNPDDLERTAREMAALTQSPEVAQMIWQRQQAHDVETEKKKHPPILRVIENTDWGRESVPPGQ